MKKIIPSIALALSLGTQTATASGIPTIDVAAIAQAVMGYTQQIQDFAEQVKMYEELTEQTKNMEKQLKEMGVDMESMQEILGGSFAIIDQLKGTYGDISSVPQDVLGSVARVESACDFLESKSTFFGMEIKRISDKYSNRVNRCIGAISNAAELAQTKAEISKKMNAEKDPQKYFALQTQLQNINNAEAFLKQEANKEQATKILSFYDTYHSEKSDNKYSRTKMNEDLKSLADQLKNTQNQKQSQALTNALLLKMLEMNQMQYELNLEYSKTITQQNQTNQGGFSRAGGDLDENSFNMEYKSQEPNKDLLGEIPSVSRDENGLPIFSLTSTKKE